MGLLRLCKKKMCVTDRRRRGRPFMGSTTPPSDCYVHLHKHIRPICTFLKYRI